MGKMTDMSAIASQKTSCKATSPMRMAEEHWILVLGNRHTPKLQELVSVLEKYSARVEVAPNPLLAEGVSSGQSPAMVVITDAMESGADTVLEIRRQLPEAGFIALFDQVRLEIEMGLRCARTLFLGSYDTFYSLSKAIVEPFLASAQTRCGTKESNASLP
jgi:hypothetical protein